MFNGYDIIFLRQKQSIYESIDPYEPANDNTNPKRSLSSIGPINFDPQLGAKSSSSTPSGDAVSASEATSIAGESSSNNYKGIQRKFHLYDKEEPAHFGQEMPSNSQQMTPTKTSLDKEEKEFLMSVPFKMQRNTSLLKQLSSGDLRVVPMIAIDFSLINLNFQDNKNMHHIDSKQNNDYRDLL